MRGMFGGSGTTPRRPANSGNVGGSSSHRGGGGSGGGPKGPSSGPSGSTMSAAAVEQRIQDTRQAMAQLKEMLRMEFSQDLCPMLDTLVHEAKEELAHLQQAGETCLAEGRLDLVEQLTEIASDLDDVQRRAEAWKAGGAGGGGGSFGNAPHMTDDERLARELAAQFQEEERAASQMGTPATTVRSHRSAQEEEDEQFARELAAAEGQQVPPPEMPPPVQPTMQPTMHPSAIDRASEGSDQGRSARKKDKKKKKEKEDAWGADFGAPPVDEGAFGGGGWPQAPAADAGAGGVSNGFQADFGAFPGGGGGGGGWEEGASSPFPSAPAPAQDFGAFGDSSSAFPPDSKPTFHGGDFATAAPSPPMPVDSFRGPLPGGDLSAFPPVDSGHGLGHEMGRAVEMPPPPPQRQSSLDSWGHSSGAAKQHAWGPQSPGETVTMHIHRPFSEIAHDLDGFTAAFVHDIAKAMGISEQRIRVQNVHPS